MRKLSLHTVAQGQGLPQGASPFISLTIGCRVLIIGYALLYNVFMPGLQEMLYSSTVPLAQWRFVTNAIYNFLLFLPILYYRPDYGWLHPLIFSTFFSLAKNLLTSPEQLLAPFLLF